MKKQGMKELLLQEQKHNTKLQKDLVTSKSSQDMWYKSSQEKDKVISEMHSMFDGIEDCADRFIEQQQQYGGTNTVELSLPARFASYQQTLIKQQ